MVSAFWSLALGRGFQAMVCFMLSHSSQAKGLLFHPGNASDSCQALERQLPHANPG